MKISDRVILPLVGSAFQPGKAAEAIEKIEDKELAQIAQGEYYFFSAQAEKCVETVKDYLDHDDVMLRLSADMLYTFANLTFINDGEQVMSAVIFTEQEAKGISFFADGAAKIDVVKYELI